MADLIGRTLGQYQIIEQIGEGGMATVYKAYQPGLDRYVAVKVLPPLHAKQPSFSERFQREAKAIANLNHQNILPVHDSGQEDNYSFIVMRYVEGARTLKEVMQTALSLSQVADLIGQIAAALDYAHRQGVVHRDVKPANVLMDGDWALLTDFGLAKMTEASIALTGTGVGVGTPAYMSPEQGQGLLVDHRTDIYSLGVILFEMVTGRIPHSAETPVAIIFKRATEPLPLPRHLNPNIPEAVERVILKALAREPEDRFASAGELAAAIKEAVRGAVVETVEAPSPLAEEWTTALVPDAPPPTQAERTPPVVSVPARSPLPWKWIAGVGGVAVILVGLVIALGIRGGPGPEPTATLLAVVPAATVPPTHTLTPVLPTSTPAPPTPTDTAFPEPTDTPEPPTSTAVPLATAGQVAPVTEAPRVGLVTDVGEVNDGAFNEFAYKGMMQAVEEFGLESAFIETQQADDYEKNVEQFVDEGFDVIVTVGFRMGEMTQKEAEANPDVNFAIVDFAYDPPLPNVMGLAFREDQAGFMAGALAGMMTKSKTVGVVAGRPVPAVKKFRNGYENGVKYVCPECNVIGVYIDSFTDPAQGKAAAESQMAEGADIIFGAAGLTGSGGILAAAQQGVWVIGVDIDEYYTTFKGGQEAGANKLLSSAMKRVDVAVYTAIREAQAGAFEGRTIVLDAAVDGVGLAPFHESEDAVPNEVKARLDEIFGMLADGSLDTGVDPASGDLLGAPAAAKPLTVGIGAQDHPIQVLFVPSVDAGVIVSGSEVMVGALEAATGLKFEVSVPTSYAATVGAMCASPDDTIGFIPALGYVIANQKCGVEVGAAAVLFGNSVYWGEFLVPRDSDYQSLEDLAGLKWAVPGLGSTPGYMFPSVMFQEAGVEPGEAIEAGGHPQAVLAVYNGEVDFATTYFSPPLTDPAWQPGDDPEPFDPMEAAMNEEGRVFVGDVRVLDARTAVIETAPDIFQKVRIMMLTDPIPNDTMSFSPDFPGELRGQVIDALVEFTASEACLESICSDQFYNWTGLDPVEDAAYDPIRRLIQGLGYTEEDIFGG